jgi:hypothetical protein
LLSLGESIIVIEVALVELGGERARAEEQRGE